MPLDGTYFETRDEVLALLHRARDRVASAWQQGSLGSHDGRVCTVGALLYASYGGPPRLLDEAMVAVGGPGATSISLAAYNDAPGRTQAEIVALFDAAIDRAAIMPVERVFAAV